MVDVSPASSSSTPAATGADGANKAAAAVEEAEGLRRARCLLSELYEIHDFFFTADKAEKKVGQQKTRGPADPSCVLPAVGLNVGVRCVGGVGGPPRTC